MIAFKEKTFSHLQKFWGYYALIFIEILLFITNYKPGTFLVGWDNLFPEFNFSLNFKRAFFAVWQEYRGMGVVDSMSHASTLVEDLERFILSFFMPMHMIRWVYIMLLHLVGGLGIFHLLKQYIFKKTKRSSETALMPVFVSFLAALFYQYNLGTIQQMYLPMEVFVVHFAFLPWLVWATLKSLETEQQKYFWYFGILSFLATPQAHVPTIFIVYAMTISIISISYAFFIDPLAWKRVVKLAVICFVTNAFWIIPFMYAVLTHSPIVANSKAFQMASNDIFYRNHEYGNLKDIALLKGTLLEYYYYNFKTHANEYMFAPWLAHIHSMFFLIPAWLSFVLGLVGAFVASVKVKSARIISGLFVFSIFMLGTDIPLIGNINAFFRENVPLFKTVFRFVFTKFSILYAFSLSVMIAVGAMYIISLVSKLKFKIMLVGIFTLAITAYIFPSFQGNFFYGNLRVEIPKKYFKTFEFFNKQDPNTRIAILPAPWYWSWLQPNWGTINSGFLWYAIPQPTTDLAFTPWSNHNENFYWELDRALNLEDIALVERVLSKYDITWIYLDRDILNAESRKVNFSSLQNLLAQSPRIKKITSFDATDIYHFENTSSKNFVSIIESLPTIAYDDSYLDYDRYYHQNGDYQKATDKKIPDTIYPYFSLFSGKAPYINAITVSETVTDLTFQSNVNNLGKNPFMVNTFPDYAPISYLLRDDGTFQTFQPKADLRISSDDNPLVEVAINKKSSLVYTSDTDKTYAAQLNTACDVNTSGTTAMSQVPDENGSIHYQLTSVNSSNCIQVEIPNLELRYGYVMKVEYTSDQKRGWFMNVYSRTSKKSVLETYLRNNGQKDTDYIILPPQSKHDLGYSIYFNNKSEGVEKVTNTLHRVEMYQIPYMEMRDLHVINSTEARSYSQTLPASVDHQSPYKYTITPNELKGSQTVVLHQGFDPGWKAYSLSCNANRLACSVQKMFPMFFGTELKDHVLVNNWANGWNLESTQLESKNNQQIVIIFWPQYLQFAGFGILGVSVIVTGIMWKLRGQPRTRH